MNKRVFNAVTNIDDDLILEANPENATKQKSGIKVIKICSIAASLCLVLGLGAFISIKVANSNKPESTSDYVFSIRYENAPSTLAGDYEQDTAPLLKWDELTIEHQYDELYFGDVTYNSTAHKVDQADLGKELGEYTLAGFDCYEDKLHEMQAKCYEIKGISTECIVAVELGDGRYFSYTNSYYKPQTLGDFADDLGLLENTTIGYAHYEWYDKKNDKYENVTFEEDILDSDIWEILLTDETREIPAVDNVDSMWLVNEISFSISSEKLGFDNISIGMTKDGYLTTNILNTGKAFFLGEEKCKELVDYVVKNYEGVIIVYNYPEPEYPETNDSSSSAVVSTVISQPQVEIE